MVAAGNSMVCTCLAFNFKPGKQQLIYLLPVLGGIIVFRKKKFGVNIKRNEIILQQILHKPLTES